MATVVVLDDDEIIRDLVVIVLETAGCTVQAFEDAGPAMASVDFSQVDLVITDLRMPTAGEELIRFLRTRGIKVPVLVMSGHVDDEKQCELRRMKVQGILHKPFQVTDLEAQVRQWVSLPAR